MIIGYLDPCGYSTHIVYTLALLKGRFYTVQVYLQKGTLV